MDVTFTPNPNFEDDLKKMLEPKLKAAFSIRCATHDETARTENGSIVACCDDLAKRVRAELEKER
jgi:hypothetical protein